ncbi:Centromere/kinetochore protein zw10 [Physocladia obscura]|uniref:Centromere/kinetochore protein zw10 n=1 Tax=Physocladia obscura TaxID=109957 RepID=A0AAD5XJE5_9FUNG|nr:Centromere/kinetochore protein zw10 [Physocladia obscura]
MNNENKQQLLFLFVAALDQENSNKNIEQHSETIESLLERLWIPAVDTIDSNQIPSTNILSEEPYGIAVSTNSLQLCIDAVERRMRDVKHQIEQYIAANQSDHENLLREAILARTKIIETTAALKKRAILIQHPETGLLNIRKAELFAEMERVRIADEVRHAQIAHEKVDEFKVAAEACVSILTDFGDLADAVDALKELELKMPDMTDCEHILSKEQQQNIYRKTQKMVIDRAEDAFLNSFVIEFSENSIYVSTKSVVQVQKTKLYADFSRSLLRAVAKPIILNPNSEISFSTHQQRLNENIVTTEKMEIQLRSLSKLEHSLENTFLKLFQVFEFVKRGLFAESLPSQELVQLIWPDFASLIIDSLMTPLIPTTPDSLRDFPKRVAAPSADFEGSIHDAGWAPVEGVETADWKYLTRFCLTIETHYCMARWNEFMEAGRNSILLQDFELVQVGDGQRNFDDDAVDSFVELTEFIESNILPSYTHAESPELSAVYPIGSTAVELLGSNLTLFPECSITLRASKIIQYIETILNEATNSSSGVSSYCSSRLYLLTRDLVTLDQSLAPVKYKTRINRLPQFAVLYHNDCLYMAHRLMEFGRAYRRALTTRFGDDALLKGDEVGYIDLAARYRKLGIQSFNQQLVTSTNGLSMANQSRFTQVSKMFAQVSHSINQLSSVWAPPLSPPFFHTRIIAGLISWAFDAVTVEILEMVDIGEEESHWLNGILIQFDESCLRLVGGLKMMRELAGASYSKFRKVTAMLVMNFAGIMELFRGGQFLGKNEEGGKEEFGLDEFSRDELVGLVRALFSDTPLRQNNISEILEGRR